MNKFLAALWLLSAPAMAARPQDAAPPFQLPNLEGRNVSLADQRGKVVFVHFWASWCMPCKEEIPKLNELARSYSKEDVVVLAITVDKAQANIEKFLKKYVGSPVGIDILRDPAGKVAESYQNRAMPITFVVDPAGKVRYVHMGFQKGDEARWRAEVDELKSAT